MQCASVLFYWESRQIFVHDFFGQDDPAIITDGYQNAQRLHTFFQPVHGFKYAPMAARFNPSSPATIKLIHYRWGSSRCARRALSAARHAIVQGIARLGRQPARDLAHDRKISCTISPRAPPVAPLSRYSTAARISVSASLLSEKFQSSSWQCPSGAFRDCRLDPVDSQIESTLPSLGESPVSVPAPRGVVP